MRPDIREQSLPRRTKTRSAGNWGGVHIQTLASDVLSDKPYAAFLRPKDSGNTQPRARSQSIRMSSPK
jgi:hypothetical protein